MSTRRKEVDLVNSLIEYVSDIKPYHTKLKNSSSEVFFEESTHITATDRHDFGIYHQNVWGKSDAGGEYLINSSDYDSTKEHIFKLPADVFPRFSLTDNVEVQTPVGDDVSTGNIIDNNDDGIPDADVPWTGPNTSSHQLGSNVIPVKSKQTFDFTITNCQQVGDEYIIDYSVSTTVDFTESDLFGFGSEYVATYNGHIVAVTQNSNVFTLADQQINFTPSSIEQTFLPTDLLQVGKYALYRSGRNLEILWIDTGRYAVPIHQGSRVRVNGTLQVYRDDYVVDSTRSWIQFTSGNHPSITAKIDVNLMKVDKFFLSYMLPFDKGDYFEIKINDLLSNRYEPVVFVGNQHYKAPLTNLVISSAALNGEIWRVQAISEWKFVVYRVNSSGQIQEYLPGVATFNKPYISAKFSFIIERTWLNYYFAELPILGTFDTFPFDETAGEGFDGFDAGHEYYSDTYNSYDDAPFDMVAFDTPADPTDHLLRLDLMTEHGVTTDPSPRIHFALAVVVDDFPFNYHTYDVDPFDTAGYDSSATDTGIVGHIKRIQDANGEEYYGFVLNTEPAFGTYIELRVEQNGQLNPWVQPHVHDCATITIVRSLQNDVLVFDICNPIPLPLGDSDPPVINELTIEIDPVLFFTSKPYPYQYRDSITSSQIAIDELKIVNFNDDIEITNFAITEANIVTFTYSDYDIATEDIEITNFAITEASIVTFTYLDYSIAEDIEITNFTITGVSIDSNVISYERWIEDIDQNDIKTSQFTITSGTLS